MALPFEDALSVAALPRGLEGEFEQRLAECGTLAFRVAYAVLRQREDAEDVAQEALARAYRQLPRLRDRERFRAWLVRIAWRLALDFRRGGRRRERRELAVAEPLPPPTPEDVAHAAGIRRRVWEAVDALPDPLRMVVVLASFEEHGLADVAALLGIPEGTVKSRLHAARQRLAEVLR